MAQIRITKFILIYFQTTKPLPIACQIIILMQENATFLIQVKGGNLKMSETSTLTYQKVNDLLFNLTPSTT